MLKFIKYDIKGSLKTLLGFLFGGMIASIIVQLTLNTKTLEYRINTSTAYYLKDVIVGAGILVAVVIVISFIVYAINSFNREINSDTGYLTFQTPEKMWKMVASKLIVMGVWSLIYLLVGFYINIILTNLLQSGSFRGVMEYSNLISNDMFYIFTTDIVMVLSLIYLSLSISKTTIKYKKLSWMWILILVVLIAATSYLKSYIFRLRPNELLPGQALVIYPFYGLELKDGDQLYYMLINLGLTVIDIFATGLVLDKKINL